MVPDCITQAVGADCNFIQRRDKSLLLLLYKIEEQRLQATAGVYSLCSSDGS